MKKILEATLLKNEDGTYQYSECNSNGFNKISDAIGASGLEEVFATVHNLPEGAVILGEDGKAFCIMWEETEMKEETKDDKVKKVELLGMGIEVEFDESEVFEHETSTGDIYEAAITTDGRLIGWDDGSNSWVQLARWAE